MSAPVRNAAAQRTPIGDAFDTDIRYWGNRFCNTSLVQPWKLLWHQSKARVKQYTLTVRPLPAKNPFDPTQWDPYRCSPGRDDFGDWIRWHWAWRRGGFGDPVTFLLHPERELDRRSPAAMLYYAIKNAVDNGSDKSGWAAMIRRSAQRGSVIAQPKRMFMIQCLIFEYGGTWYEMPRGLGEMDRIPLLDLGSDAAKTVLRFAREVDPNYQQQHEDDWERRYLYGDLVGLEAGKFFEIHPEDAPPPHLVRPATRGPAPDGPRRLDRSAMQRRRRDDDDAQGDDDKDVKGYTAQIYDAAGPEGYTPDLSLFQDELYERVKPWADVLLFPTYEEQAQLIAPLLRLPSSTNPAGELRLDTIEFAWKDHPEWMPAHDSPLWKEWVHRISVQVGGIPGQPAGREAGQYDDRGYAPGAAAPAVVDEALPAQPSFAQSAAPAADPPPRRQRLSRSTAGAAQARAEAAAAPAEPAPVEHPTARPGQVPAADHFRRMEEEEQALKAEGIKPAFPAPGRDEPQEAPVPAGGEWRQRLANLQGKTGPVAPFVPTVPPPVAAPIPAAAPAGGYRDQLARLKAASDKVGKS